MKKVIKDSWTVLITSAGSNAALSCINALQNQSELNLILMGVDVNAYAAGLYLVDKSLIVPSVNDDLFIGRILRICEENNVDVLIPIHSTEIHVFAQHKNMFELSNVRLLISNPSTIELFDNKWMAYNFFLKNKISTPATYMTNNIPSEKDFPLIMKPLVGSGSKGTMVMHSKKDIEKNIEFEKRSEFLLQKYLVGSEITCDMMIGRNSEIHAIVPRERLKLRGGMAVVAKTIELLPQHLAQIKNLIESSSYIGPINIQMIVVDKKIYIIDVNPRFAAGGLPLSIRAGVNFPLLLLKILLNVPLGVSHKYYEVGCTMIRYYTELFISESELVTDN